jgi:hypothetical protein
MSDLAINFLVIGFVCWVIWTILQAQYSLDIRVKGGQPSIRKRKATPRFLDCVTEVCREHEIVQGWVSGVQHGRRMSLHFSRHFPPEARQRLRNAWQWAG